MTRKKGQGVRVWTEEEHAQMMTMVRRDRKTFARVGEILGRTESAVKQRYQDFKDGGGFRKTEREMQIAAEAARREALALEHSSITAAFCGDPLPGRSALDKRPCKVRPSISLSGDGQA